MNVLDSFLLKGKVAVVTGGKGMYGRQVAEALYEAGAKVYMASRGIDELEQVAEEMQALGGDVTACYADLAKEKTLTELVDKVVSENGRLDILANNAVARTMSSYYDNAENFDKSMHINATGTFILTRAAGEQMIKQKSGSIINIASMQGMIGPTPALYENLGMDGFIPDYYFHKGGMIQYTRFLASFYGSHNIRCNVVSPGGLQSHRTPEEFVKRYSKHTMLGRMANNSDLKGVITFLASDASLYITAANIPVDGGYIAK